MSHNQLEIVTEDSGTSSASTENPTDTREPSGDTTFAGGEVLRGIREARRHLCAGIQDLPTSYWPYSVELLALHFHAACARYANSKTGTRFRGTKVTGYRSFDSLGPPPLSTRPEDITKRLEHRALSEQVIPLLLLFLGGNVEKKLLGSKRHNPDSLKHATGAGQQSERSPQAHSLPRR